MSEVNYNFNTETLLYMDYRTLQQYMEMMVMRKPGIVLEMRKHPVGELMKKMDAVKAMSYLVTVRCICAFIGIADPVTRAPFILMR